MMQWYRNRGPAASVSSMRRLAVGSLRAAKSDTPLKLARVHSRLALAAIVLAVSFGLAASARAQDCTTLLSLFQRGLSTAQISQMTGLSGNDVEACRRQLSQPIFVGPAGPPPVGAAGPPPRGAAGPPPLGAAGPPPVGHEVKRLP